MSVQQKNQLKNKFKKIKFLNGKWKVLLFISIVVMILESFLELENKSIDEMIGYVFGYIAIGNYNVFLRSLITFMLPQIAILLIWGNYFDDCILGNANIIFTRTRQVSKVLLKFTMELILGVSITVILLIGGLSIIYFMKGYRVYAVIETIENCVLYMIYINLLVITVNLISLSINVMYSVLSVFTIQLGFLHCIYMIKTEILSSNLYYVLPTASSMMFFNNEITNRIKIGWLIYMIALMLILYFISCAIVKKKEFLA